MSRLAKLGVAVAVVGFGVWFYATPYIAMSGAEKAAKAGDASALAGYVDFPALKASFKTNITASIAAQNHVDPTNPMQALGVALANAFVDPLVEVMVTPQNLALLFQGKNPSLDKSSRNTGVASSSSSESDVVTKAGYESYDRFIVQIKNEKASKKSLTLVLNREGFATWKLAGIRMPAEDEADTGSVPQRNVDAAPPAVIPPVSSQQQVLQSPVIAQPNNPSPVVQQPQTAPAVVSQSSQPAQSSSNDFAPSFDCAKVSTGAERLICGNQQLSAADVKLSQVYQAKRERVLDKDQLKQQQIQWRRTVRDACSDSSCMLKAYQARITELSQ